MRKYKEVVDYAIRRFGPFVESDKVQTIYAEMDESRDLTYTVVLRPDADPNSAVPIETRYKRMCSERLMDIDINVLLSTQYFKQGKLCFPIYKEKEGFKL